MTQTLSLICTISFLSLTTAVYAEDAPIREWKDRRGKVLAEGTYVESKNDTILIKSKEGKTVQLKTKDLSSTDTRYIRVFNHLKEIRQKSDRGDDKSMLLLGHTYYFGKYVPRDDKKAIELYQQAKDKGNVQAMHALAIMYEHGFGVEQDRTRAFELYKKAGNGGVAAASVRAGLMRYQGLGGKPRDLKASAGWFGQGARDGDVQGMFLIGMSWKKGQGVEQHAEMAEKWLKKASDAGYTPAMMELAHLYRHLRSYRGTARVKRPSNNDLLKLYERAAGKRNNDAMFQLAFYYHRQKSLAKAVRWYRKGAKLGNAQCQYYLGTMHEEGDGVRKNEKKAFEYYLQAAENPTAVNPSDAHFALSLCYRDGKGVAKDPQKARYYLNLKNTADNRSVYKLYNLIGLVGLALMSDSYLSSAESDQPNVNEIFAERRSELNERPDPDNPTR